jgi:hypothetical protein
MLQGWLFLGIKFQRLTYRRRAVQFVTIYAVFQGMKAIFLTDDWEDDDDDDKDDDKAFKSEKNEDNYRGQGEEGELNEEEYEDEIDEDHLFIPLGFAREAPLEPYAGDDPEYMEFVHFSRDQDRREAVQTAVRNVMFDVCLHDQRFASHLGEPLAQARYWLDFDYPLYPPVEYERPGYV